MKLFDIAATLVVVALVFVALLMHVLAPKPPLASPAPGVVAENPARASSLCKTFLETTIDGNFAAFKNECLKEGDGQMKLFAAQRTTREMFLRAAQTLGPVCQKGYELEYLTSMNQQGSEIHIWKLVPRLGSNQFLVRLTLTDGKVSGFFFQ